MFFAHTTSASRLFQMSLLLWESEIFIFRDDIFLFILMSSCSSIMPNQKARMGRREWLKEYIGPKYIEGKRLKRRLSKRWRDGVRPKHSRGWRVCMGQSELSNIAKVFWRSFGGARDYYFAIDSWRMSYAMTSVIHRYFVWWMVQPVMAERHVLGW